MTRTNATLEDDAERALEFLKTATHASASALINQAIIALFLSYQTVWDFSLPPDAKQQAHALAKRLRKEGLPKSGK